MPLPDDQRDNPLLGEIMAEKASAYFQSIRKMQAAIHAFQQFPAGQNTSAPARRDDLLAEAAEQVWYFLIHREALRLPYYSEIFADYDIPLEIQKRIGPRNLPAPAQNPAKR